MDIWGRAFQASGCKMGGRARLEQSEPGERSGGQGWEGTMRADPGEPCGHGEESGSSLNDTGDRSQKRLWAADRQALTWVSVHGAGHRLQGKG